MIEKVNSSHPDRIAGAIVDLAYRKEVWLKIDDTTLYFIPITRIEWITGRRFKEYYFNKIWKGCYNEKFYW